MPPDGGTAIQEDPAGPVFHGNGPDDYVCVECGNLLAASMDGAHMTKKVRVALRALQDGQRRRQRRSSAAPLGAASVGERVAVAA